MPRCRKVIWYLTMTLGVAEKPTYQRGVAVTDYFWVKMEKKIKTFLVGGR